MYSEMFGGKEWIGSEDERSFGDEIFPSILNPFGECRCGSKMQYKDCCMKNDTVQYIKELSKIGLVAKDSIKNPVELKKKWDIMFAIPDKMVISKLKREFGKVKNNDSY